MDKPNFDYILKYIIVGDGTVGKSSLLLRFTKSGFNQEYEMTLSVDFGVKNIKIRNKIYRIQIFDTAGQENLRSIARMYYKNSICAIVVYDITRRDTFNNVSDWIEECKNYSPKSIFMVLVGNKLDLAERRQISSDEGRELAEKNGMLFFETSAKDGTNVENITTFNSIFFFDSISGVLTVLSIFFFFEVFLTIKDIWSLDSIEYILFSSNSLLLLKFNSLTFFLTEILFIFALINFLLSLLRFDEKDVFGKLLNFEIFSGFLVVLILIKFISLFLFFEFLFTILLLLIILLFLLFFFSVINKLPLITSLKFSSSSNWLLSFFSNKISLL